MVVQAVSSVIIWEWFFYLIINQGSIQPENTVRCMCENEVHVEATVLLQGFHGFNLPLSMFYQQY